ncbi:MAG TPA: helix-turn-helix domain-containing protein [Bacteroidia bacterium]|nr:helix-turn-helix domain-containing protein [Bacteroidia bacterium]
MKNKEKFLSLVSKEKTNTLERNRERIKNRAMLRESQQIAIKVLKKLDELGWSKKDLADALEVAPQQITKIVSGQENLTIETQIKLQNALDIPILASYYEKKEQQVKNTIVFEQKKIAYPVNRKSVTNYSRSNTKTRMIKMDFNQSSSQSKYKKAV